MVAILDYGTPASRPRRPLWLRVVAWTVAVAVGALVMFASYLALLALFVPNWD